MALIMEAETTSETSVYFNENTRLSILEGCILFTHRLENLKYHSYLCFCTTVPVLYVGYAGLSFECLTVSVL
jgi:hypothetical protein